MPEHISIIIITFKAQMTLLISSCMLIAIGNCHRSPVTSLTIADIYDLLWPLPALTPIHLPQGSDKTKVFLQD